MAKVSSASRCHRYSHMFCKHQLQPLEDANSYFDELLDVEHRLYPDVSKSYHMKTALLLGQIMNCHNIQTLGEVQIRANIATTPRMPTEHSSSPSPWRGVDLMMGCSWALGQLPSHIWKSDTYSFLCSVSWISRRCPCPSQSTVDQSKDSPCHHPESLQL